MKAYKGFNKDMTCRGFQFKEGETYEEPEAKLCESGFHACENPLDCFRYYSPAKSVFHEVELEDVSDERQEDSKVCAKRISIGARLDVAGIVKCAIDFVFTKADWSKKENHATGDYGASSATGFQGASSATGRYGASSATGFQGASSATGDYGASSATGFQGASSATGRYGASSATGFQGASSATGDYGASSATGFQGVAAALGIEGKAMGAAGCWIICAEWAVVKGEWNRVDVKCAKVDGVTIKPDTWYKLKNGEFVEVED